uniref:Uncharacterized protein n=1 Tax=Cucumis melo TaxID=3656 RepID=A0A9I9E4P3_CUCME
MDVPPCTLQNFLLYCSSMASQISFFPLNTGANIPSLRLGTWQATDGLLTNAIVVAVKGYRVISVDILCVWNHQEWIQTFEST